MQEIIRDLLAKLGEDPEREGLLDTPKRIEKALQFLTSGYRADVDAVVQHFNEDKAIIVGHGWGGIVAWTYAMTHPDKTDKLVILNLPHPRGLARELAKAGNARVRRGLIQLAWRFLLFQKDSALARWYRTRTEGPNGARKTTMIVALARKLLIALWRLVTTGEIPDGVELRPAA